MVLTKKVLMAEMVGSGVADATQKLDDVVGAGAPGVGTIIDPGIVAYEAPQTVFVKRIVLSNHDSGAAFNMNGFGGENALTNGLKIVKVTNAGDTTLIGETTLKNYSDFVEKGFKIERDVADADWFQLVLDFEKACGTYIKLRIGERIEVRNQDDLSDVSHVAFSVNGFIG